MVVTSISKASKKSDFGKWRNALHNNRQAGALSEPQWVDEFGIVRSDNGLVRFSRTLYTEGSMSWEDFAPVFIPLQTGFTHKEQYLAKRCFMTNYLRSSPEYRRALEDSALGLSDTSPDALGKFWDFETEYKKSYAQTYGTVHRITLASEVPYHHMPSF